MTTYFVSAVDGNNANDGLAWSGGGHAPKQTVAGAIAIPPVSGDTIVVDNAGTFTANAAITWTLISGVTILSVTRSGSSGWTRATGATEAVGAANAAFNLSMPTGGVYIYGMFITGGTNNSSSCNITIPSNTTVGEFELDTCKLTIATISTGAQITISGGAGGTGVGCLNNCTFACTASRAGNLVSFGTGNFDIIAPIISLTGATKPTGLFIFLSGTTPKVIIRDADLTGFATSGGAYFTVTNLIGSVILANSKISATPALLTGTFPAGKGEITVRNTDSADTIYELSYYNAYGTLTTTTSIYKNGGVTFGGTIPTSWKIVTTSVCSQYSPFRIPPILIWDTTLIAQTSAIEFAQDSAATALTDQEIWSDLDYPASATDPHGAWQNNRNAAPITGTPANQPTSTATWTGLTMPTMQKLNNAFTAAEVGLLQSIVSIGKASTPLYINPNIDGVI